MAGVARKESTKSSRLFVDRGDSADPIVRGRATSGSHRRDGNVAIDHRGSDEIVRGNVFVGLVGDVKRAGAEHDADGAGVPIMHEVTSAGQSAGLRKLHPMP